MNITIREYLDVWENWFNFGEPKITGKELEEYEKAEYSICGVGKIIDKKKTEFMFSITVCWLYNIDFINTAGIPCYKNSAQASKIIYNDVIGILDNKYKDLFHVDDGDKFLLVEDNILDYKFEDIFLNMKDPYKIENFPSIICND